jgi:signal transduction histidine kinase
MPAQRGLRTLIAMASAPPTDAEPATFPSRALVDALLVVVIALVEIVATAFAAEQQDRGALGVAGVTLLLLGVLALPLRHRHPVAVLWWVLGTTLAYWSLGYPRGPVFFALLVALAQAVLTGHRRAAIASLLLGFVGFLWLAFWLGREPAPGWGETAALAAWLTALLCVTELVRSRRDRAREAARLHAEAELRRVADERMRIARDIHDAVAHNMSLINIQAGVALHLMDEEPGRAREALSTIKDASKEALVELRSIVGVLRQVDEDAPRSPTPSLARLDDLVTNAAAAGVDVRVDLNADLGAVPRSTDLAAFRILQESLTNVARHSDAHAAVVRLHTRDGVLGIEVLDEGTGRGDGQGAGLPGGGNGIAGMRERAASVGGRLEAGPRPGGGFAVRAELPLDAS